MKYKNGEMNEMKKRKELARKQEENMLFYFIYKSILNFQVYSYCHISEISFMI